MRISRKVRIVDALLLGGLFLFSGCASPSKPRLSADAQAEALSHFSLGLLAEAGGDSAAALEHFEAAVRLDPDEEKIYAPAVATALKLERTNDAVRLAQKLVKRRPGSAEPQLLLARVYALTGSPDQAGILFRKVQTDFPDHPDAPVFLARLHLSQERYGEALDVLRTAAVSQNKNPDLLHLLGTLCIDSARNKGDTSEAKAAIEEGIGFLQQALELSPQDPLRWQQLGFAQLAVRNPDEALKAFKEARLYAPSDLMLARHVFELLIQTGRYDEAMMIYDRLADETGTEPEPWLQYLAEKMPEKEHARLSGYLEEQIRNQPKAPVFYYAQIGSLYIGAGKNREAEDILLKALERYPDDNRLRIVLGYLHLKQEQFDTAYAELEQVRAKSPEAEWSANPFFLFNFLVSAQKSGHLEQAAETLASTYTNNPVVLNQYMLSLLTDRSPISTEGAIELLNVFHTLSPEAAEALYYLMMLQAEQKEYAKAIETAKQFEVLAQKSGETNLLSGQFYYQYAALHERNGQLETAEKLFFKAIDLGEEPVASSAQNYIAYMWAERGQKLDLGLQLIQKALAADPENGAFLDTLGWIYYMQGRYPEALKELQKARLLEENDPTVWEHLGDTWLKLGNMDEASKHWKKALELDPEDHQRLFDRLKETGIKPEELPAPADSPADTMPRP
jgi:tetratricopeptide (TPR) repeat protein